MSVPAASSLPLLLLTRLFASRLPVLLLLALQEEARKKAAATTIQSFWRAVRARHLTTIQRALFKIRQIQGGAAKGTFDHCRGCCLGAEFIFACAVVRGSDLFVKSLSAAGSKAASPR